MRIERKVVVITGASEGIGAACAAAFRSRGALVSLTARSAEKLAAAAGPDGLATPGDITDPEVRRSVVARTVERFGGIDVLVNNAGRGFYHPAHQASAEDAERLFALNFFAPLDMARLAAAHMRERGGGTIVNVGSIAGRVTLPWMTLYSASKYALGALTDGLRMELAGTGIHAMTVCPGYVHTRFQANAEGRPPSSVVKAKRFAITAEECAEAIVRGVERGARTVMTPRSGWLLVALARVAPRLVDARLAAMNGSI
jgi:short-subunit dehydrogenase